MPKNLPGFHAHPFLSLSNRHLNRTVNAMGQICSICGFKEKPQQATANVKTHQLQQSHSSSPLFNMNTNISNSANVIFFLYTEGAIVPEDVTHLRVDPSVMIIPFRAFMGRHQLKEVVLPEGLTVIGSGAFEGCNSLEHINFPSTLTAIGDWGWGAFNDCISLREVDLSNVKTIGEYAFRGCTALERINFPSTLTAIGPYAFYKCTSLREVKLSNVITIGDWAFWEVDLSNVITIGEYAFYGCTSLECINFPSTLTAIGPYAFGVNAFAGCTSLREVDLSNLKTIGRAAFEGCTSLERINFPSTLTAIGDGAFMNCASLREVKLVGGILDIGKNAFYHCSSMTRFQIPSKAFVIETGASNCRLLTSGTITSSRNDGQVVIASRCLKNMSLTGLAEFENRINAIIGVREQTREENLEQVHVLFADYELVLVEATIILELALWKAKLDEGDDLNTREECRFTCGAGIIIKNVLPFL